MNSQISVIIPCRNATNYLADAVESIRKHNVSIEIIIVDDGSTDSTANMAKALGCTVISISHSGLSAARNVGLQNAAGDFILFLDHDDVLTEDSLNRLCRELENDPDAGLVEAMLEDFVSPELGEEDKKILAPRPEPYYGLLTGAVLFRRKVFDHSGIFDEKLETGQGVEFMLRVKSKGIKIKRLDFISARRRLHNTNMGRTMQKQEKQDYSALLRARLRG
jgi:glycosyltransferase involved in cell wall biosynthesis